MRDDFAEGTDNICLQIIQGNLLRKTNKEAHRCYNKGIPTMRHTARVDDRWFYFYYDDEEEGPCYRFYLMQEGW